MTILSFLKAIFIKTKKIIDWFSKGTHKGFGLTNAGKVLVALLFVLGGIIKYTSNNRIEEICIGVFGTAVFFIFPMAFIKSKQIKFLRKYVGEHNTPMKLFSTFSNISYLYGLFYLNGYLVLYLIFFVYCFSLIFLRIPINLSGYYFNIFYFALIIYTVMWFSYHLIFETVSINRIRKKVSLYLAILTSISLLAIWPIYEVAFKPIAISVGVGFSWLIYLIDTKQCENDQLTKKR